MKTNKLDPELLILLNLNNLIHGDSKKIDYHMNHIKIAQKYAVIINNKLGCPVSNRKLSYIAFAHDLFKERGLNPNKNVIWNGITIPQDNIRYVRTNLDILEEYELDEYFNSSLQYHALASGIFLKKELNINDNELLYPIFFHSSMIVDIYKKLNWRIRTMIDIFMLADKLSSNYLKINFRESPVRIDLDQVVFGNKGKEFNYTMGLFIARLISQGKSPEKNSIEATEYYFQRLKEINPFISKDYSIKILGGNKIWPKRKSQVLTMR